MIDECQAHLSGILTILEELNAYKDVDAILDKLLFEVRHLVNADGGSIFLSSNRHLKFSYIQNETLFRQDEGLAEQYADLTVPINETSIVGYAAQTGQTITVADAHAIPASCPYTFNPSFDEKFGYRTTSIFAAPLRTMDNRLVGVLELINARDDKGRVVPFSDFSKVLIPLFANNATLAIEKGMMNRELILRMVKMTQLRDPKETGTHVQRVGAYSAEIYRRVAVKRGLPFRDIRRTQDLIRLAAMLHDIGKIGIRDDILKKPGQLTPEEFDIMKWHPVHGAALFENTTSQLDVMSRDISLFHHERWDGKGYPGKVQMENGTFRFTGIQIRGKQIPLVARIVTLADVFDALSSERCYKVPWPEKKVLSHIRAQSGQHFDPEVVTAFFEIQDVIRAIGKRYSA